VFRREGGGLSGRFSFEGQVVEFADGDSVAAALLGHGVTVFRESAVSGAPRGPWCLMGVCFDCLGEIDGVGGRQACLEAARDGMVVRRMRGAR
jgi:hypothetical protein